MKSLPNKANKLGQSSAVFELTIKQMCSDTISPLKQDMVESNYELPAPPKSSTVAVKIIDMLGKEVIVKKTM